MLISFRNILLVLILPTICGCGTHYPQLSEPWEGSDINRNIETDIKENIYCELATAIYNVNSRGNRRTNGTPLPILPDYYGVQMEISLQVSEGSGFGPSITYNDPLRMAQMFNLAFGATLSTTATRTDVLNSYYNVGKISTIGVVQRCRDERSPYTGSSPLLESDLGIETFLTDAATQADLYPSSLAPESKKDAKFDVFSYQIKFEVITNGSVNPSWKLSRVSANTGSNPLISAGRSRTHYLLLTFGPTITVDPLSGMPLVAGKRTNTAPTASTPTQAAIDAHLAQQIGIAVQNSLTTAQ